jgi:hypothetical protein
MTLNPNILLGVMERIEERGLKLSLVEGAALTAQAYGAAESAITSCLNLAHQMKTAQALSKGPKRKRKERTGTDG